MGTWSWVLVVMLAGGPNVSRHLARAILAAPGMQRKRTRRVERVSARALPPTKECYPCGEGCGDCGKQLPPSAGLSAPASILPPGRRDRLDPDSHRVRRVPEARDSRTELSRVQSAVARRRTVA